MMDKKQANYDEIAQVYDHARVSEAPHLEWWYQRMIEAGQLGPGKQLLDLGCGTGRLTLPLVQRCGCAAVGFDKSAEMLNKAQEKDAAGRVTWVQGDMAHMPLESGRFDCVLMSLLLHFIEDYLGVFTEVRRVLRSGGVLLIRQPLLDDSGFNFCHRFFPGTLTIDRKRTPFLREVEVWLCHAGFIDIHSELRVQLSYPDLDRLLREMRLRVASALRMISDEEFQSGLAAAEAYLAQHPEDETLRQDRVTFITARKPQ